MPIRTEIVITLGEVLECHPPGQNPYRRKRYNSFEANRGVLENSSAETKENVAPDATCDPRGDGMKQRKLSERSELNGCEEDGLPTHPSAIGRRRKTRTASIDSSESDEPVENAGRLRQTNSFKHLVDDSCSSFLDKDDDEEISFHPDTIVQDEQSTNGSDSKQTASPKRKSSDEKVLEDNIHYYQYEVCKGKTRSNKTFEEGADESGDSCKKTEDFQNNFLKFLEQNNIKREGPPEGRTRHKSGPSIGSTKVSKPRGKRQRTTSSCGRISPKSDDESGRASRISVNGSEDEFRSRSRRRSISTMSNTRSRSRKRSASTSISGRRTASRSRLELNPLYSPSPSETGSNADSSVSNFSIKKLSVEITRLPEIMTPTPEPCLDSDALADDDGRDSDDSENEEEEPCTRTTRSAKIEAKSDVPIDDGGGDSDNSEDDEEEPCTRTTRSAKTEIQSNTAADDDGGDSDDSEDEEEEACMRTTRSAKTETEVKSLKRTRRSELDKLFEAGVSSFHCESAAAERKRLSDLGTPLNIDCSDSCESEVNSVTSAKRKLSDIDCDNEGNDSRKKSKASVSSRPGKGKNSEASDSDNVGNNGNNLLKTISPARSKTLAAESEEEEEDGSVVWDGWERLEEELVEIDTEPIDPDSLYCSFEQNPSHEGWFQTYSRQDRGDEIVFYPDIVGAPFLLPYEMSYASFLPSKQPISQSIASSSGTTTPVRGAKLQQDRLVVRTSQSVTQSDRGSKRGTPRGGTPARSVVDDSVKSKKCTERKVSVSESEHSTDSEGSRKGKSKFGPKSTHLLDSQPRISPRCHASTKALLNAGSVGDEEELADFLLMEEMSETVPGHYPFIAHDESSNDSTFSSVSQTKKSKSKSESIGEFMALAASLDRVLRQPDPELLTDKIEVADKHSGSKDVDKGKTKTENAVTATRSRTSSEQLLSPKNKKDKTKKKKTVLGEAPMDLIVARAVDGVLLDCLEDELPTVPFDECVPGSDVMSLLSDYKSCDSMTLCNSRWLRPKFGSAKPPRSLAVNKEKSRQRSPARPKIIYKEDSDADVETTDVDSVSVSSFGSSSSRKRGKRRKVNMTGFPSPKKKKKLINKTEQGPKIVMPRKNPLKVPYRPKGFIQQVQNAVNDAALKSKKNTETPSKSEKMTKVKSETKEKQPKIEKFLKRSPKSREDRKTSPITVKLKRRKSDECAKRIGKRSKTVNYREQESDTESIFEAANMSPTSLKVPYRSKEFVLQQQALNAANSSNKTDKVDKANSLKKSEKRDKKMTRSKR